MKVTFSKSTVVFLAALAESKIESDRITALKIYKQLTKRLPFDPHPNIKNKNEIFHSMPFMALKNEGIDVSRLKSSEYLKYRIFYIVDEDADCIYILHIVEKSPTTYELDTSHIETIKRLYIEYYTNKNK